MKLALMAFGFLTITILVMVAIGFCLPVKHQAVREATLPQSASSVWQKITDFRSSPAWRPDVKTVKPVTEGGETLWEEANAHGEAIRYRTLESVAPRRLVRQIANRDLPFGGRWTFELSDEGSGCRLRLTEDGEVYNPVYRFMSRFVLGHTATLDTYLTNLRKALAGKGS